MLMLDTECLFNSEFYKICLVNLWNMEKKTLEYIFSYNTSIKMIKAINQNKKTFFKYLLNSSDLSAARICNPMYI